MKYLGKITDNKDLVTKEYVDGHHDSDKQDTLVSGTNIKTINNQSLLGSGNITIQGGGEPSAITDERIEEICELPGTDGFTLTVSSSAYGTWTITYVDGSTEMKSGANFAGTYSNVVSFKGTPFAGALYDKTYTYDITNLASQTETLTESQHVFVQTGTITLPSDMTILNTWDDD